MRQWLENTVDRILRLKPQRVLEIGCGTGLLLFRVAPHCQRYCGSDFSSRVIQHLKRHLSGPEQELPQVTLRQAVADNFQGLEAEGFDLVVLNSVAQYFPGIDYLVRVLEGAAKIVRRGGAIFIGDVRSLPHLEAFHASVQLHKASDSLGTGELRELVRKQLRLEEELAVAPDFFQRLKQCVPGIGRVEIQLKRGSCRNELTRFRYDVTLHLDGNHDMAPGQQPGTEPACIDWAAGAWTLRRVRDYLQRERPPALRLQGVPDVRLQVEAHLRDLLFDDHGPETVGQLRNALRKAAHASQLNERAAESDPAVDPEDLWRSGEELGYEVAVSPPGHPPAGYPRGWRPVGHVRRPLQAPGGQRSEAQRHMQVNWMNVPRSEPPISDIRHPTSDLRPLTSDLRPGRTMPITRSRACSHAGWFRNSAVSCGTACRATWSRAARSWCWSRCP